MKCIKFRLSLKHCVFDFFTFATASANENFTPVSGQLIIVIPASDNYNFTFFYLIYQPVFSGNSSRPTTL